MANIEITDGEYDALAALIDKHAPHIHRCAASELHRAIIEDWLPTVARSDEIDRLRAEVTMLRGEIECAEQEAEDLRQETGVTDLEGQLMASREDAAKLRALLRRAGEALETVMEFVPLGYAATARGGASSERNDRLATARNTARTITREIEEAM